ncbi:MAG: polysaccharide deacetylase family protein, partial [Chitinispirillaceae bacterium]|nr:polysaccharide deacetylase family protein [Chitinispirillaceae bacterium]
MHPYKRSPKKKNDKESLYLKFIITILLFSIMLNFIMIRKNRDLQTYNKILRESRALLIENLKESNKKLLQVDSTIVNNTQKIDSSICLKVNKTIEKNINTSKESPFCRTTLSKSDYPYHISNGPVNKKVVSFTFDGGSLANCANAILDTLQSRGVKATMFLSGEFIKKYPEIVKRIVSDGHECGNHTYSHPHLTTYQLNRKHRTLPDVNEVFLDRELLQTAELFFKVTGQKMVPFWRAPYGEFNNEICQWAYMAGYTHIGWRQGKSWFEGLDSNDWITDPDMPGYHTPQDFVDKIISIAKSKPYGINGGIILMHLGTNRKKVEDNIHNVLGVLIDSL